MALETLNVDTQLLSERKQLVSVCNRIYSLSRNVVQNFMELGKLLKDIKDKELYKLANYEDFYEFAKQEFSYGTTSVKNLISVYEKFSNKNDNYLEISNKYKNFNYTQLVELVPIDENQLTDFSPEMSIKEIRYKKLENKISNDVKKIYEYFNTKFYEALKEVVDVSSCKFKITKKENSITNYTMSSIDIKLVIKELSGWYLRIDLIGSSKDYYIDLSISTDNYKRHKLDVSISLVLKHLNSFIKECFEKTKIFITNDISTNENQLTDSIPQKKETNFKNNKAREEFLYNLDNYNLLYDLSLLGVYFVRNKYFNELIAVVSIEKNRIQEFYWYTGNYYFFYQNTSVKDLCTKIESRPIIWESSDSKSTTEVIDV